MYTPIIHLQEGGTYSHTIMIADAYTIRQEKPYTKITIQDVTGKIEGVVWNFDKKKSPGILESGKFVNVKNLIVKMYRGELQFSVNSVGMQVVKQPENIHDYVVGPNENVLNVLAQDLEQFIAKVDDVDYRDIIGNATQSLELVSTLRNSPYKLDGPLAYRGGLLTHILPSIKMALTGADIIEYPINKSLVIVGCIFRNIGWSTTSMFIGNQTKPLDAFYMTGIYRAGMRFVNHLCMNVESAMKRQLPEGKKQALENMCNDMQNIRTVEGKIVAHADAFIDTLNTSNFYLQRKSNQTNWNEGLFTGHVRS